MRRNTKLAALLLWLALPGSAEAIIFEFVIRPLINVIKTEIKTYVSPHPLLLLKASDGSWVTADYDNEGKLTANRSSAALWEGFRVRADGPFIVMDGVKDVTRMDWKFVCADRDLGGQLVANRTAVGEWEKLSFIPQAGGAFAIRSTNGKYVAADFNKGGLLVADRTQVGAWEKFHLYGVPNLTCDPGINDQGQPILSCTYADIYPIKNLTQLTEIAQ